MSGLNPQCASKRTLSAADQFDFGATLIIYPTKSVDCQIAMRMVFVLVHDGEAGVRLFGAPGRREAALRRQRERTNSREIKIEIGQPRLVNVRFARQKPTLRVTYMPRLSVAPNCG